MKQCETCNLKEYRKDISNCMVHELHFRLNELYKQIPIVNKFINGEYDCVDYENENNQTNQ